jgi:hypothetical protein
MIFALGRVLEYHDMPVVRQIVRDAKADNYRFSAIVMGIANSAPFRMRIAPEPPEANSDDGTVAAVSAQ